jgi:multiple antibiotic resistance protein
MPLQDGSQTGFVLLKSFAFAFSALFPVINPIGSALIFLRVVGDAKPAVFRPLARKIALSTVLFLLIIELGGAALLAFFEISLPVVQFAGGLVLAAMGWQMLNVPDNSGKVERPSDEANGDGALEDQIFYPLTFPITAGPGCIVVTLTLSAHASRHALIDNLFAHVGIALAILASGVTVLLSYASAPRMTRKIKPQTAHGILRVVAFVLLCIGVQIGWKGLEAMVSATPRSG